MTRWTGKIIGLIIGALFANPLAIIIGVVIGHLYDIGLIHKWLGMAAHGQQHNKIQEAFFDTTFMIMGYVAKSDGRVSENEIRTARQVMSKMGLNESMKREAIRLFNEGKQPNFDLDYALQRLRQACWRQPSLLRLFLEIQIQMACADSQTLSAQKQQTLELICQKLGIVGFSFSQFEQRYRAEQNYQYHRAQPQDSRQHLSEAYQILGVSANASDAEVKKAYRRLMSQNHPDKLMSKGLPPEMIKVATQKTQQVKKAYEQIRKVRGI